MPGCAAYGCSNSSKKGFIMKVFPRDPVIRAIWAEKVNRDGWTPTNHSCLCEIHFESEKWEKTRVDGRRKLKWNAVPTLFAHVKINKQKRKSPTKRGSPIKKIKLVRTRHTSVPDQQHMECEDTESLPSTEHQSSPISSSLQVCKSYHCPKYGNPEPDTELQNIKQEPDYETTINMETQSMIPSEELKQEPDYEVQTVKKEANEEEESDMSPFIERASISSTSLSCPDENSFLYCNKCQLKYEEGCTEHGPVIYMDNAEEGQGEGYCQDSSPQVQVVDNKDRQVLGTEKVEQSKVCEAHSDDVGTLPNKCCNTESDEMFSVCEMNTELCGAGTSCGLQSNVEMSDELCVAGSNCGSQSNVEMRAELCVAVMSNVLIKASHYIHNSENPFKKKTHMRTHTGERPYKCDVCGTGFTEQGHLMIHKKTHTREKPYKCDVCGTGFTVQGHLRKHKRTHTGEKPYTCDVCGTGFNRQGDRKVPQRTHTGEKPYKCDVCGLGFTRHDHLKIHKRSHTGERPYTCDVCGTGFTAQSNLKRHMRTHTGEKPYKCDLCGTGFTQQGHLKVHKRTHTEAIQM